jgi:hypothetical protein
LRAADVPDDKARAAAVEAAGFENRIIDHGRRRKTRCTSSWRRMQSLPRGTDRSARGRSSLRLGYARTR